MKWLMKFVFFFLMFLLLPFDSFAMGEYTTIFQPQILLASMGIIYAVRSDL